jgi:primosomal protein N' (replication factor Y)
VSGFGGTVAAVLIEVAVGAPVRGTFSYDATGVEGLVPGRRLIVPFGRRRAIAFALGPTDVVPPGGAKPVERVLDDGPLFPPDVLALVRFAADYYLYPLGEALRQALPPSLGRLEEPEGPQPAVAITVHARVGAEVAASALARSPSQAALFEHLIARGGSVPLEELRAAVKGAGPLVKRLEERGLVELSREAKAEDGGARHTDPGAFGGGAQPTPTPAQAAAFGAILGAEGFAPFLLHGVTGSGKTEVYLRTIAGVRQRGKGALVLVPEIALTPQLAGRFRARFGAEVAVLHSGLTDRERAVEHRRLLSGEARIAVGVRSAVFAPVRDLGVIVVDEEHEPSFKQEEKLRYHARDLAVYRARLAGVPCVLGSATPSLESLRNAREGKYRLLELPERVDSRPLPTVELVDLSRRGRGPSGEGAGDPASGPGGEGTPAAPGSRPAREAGRRGRGPDGEPELISPPLARALAETLARGQQAILFLNRRGHASLMLCPVCGESARCPNCDVSLTHHLAKHELRCHYCDHRIPEPEACPECGGALLALGVGTERVEKELHRRFPGARVSRLDRDAAGNSAELTRILARFARREADVLVGTQMVAKGHDFPGVTLVGVILADVGLSVPDFRAAERTFQLLTQVAGRAGRGRDAGRVLIQSFHPESDAVARVIGHDYAGFAEAELARRREFGWAPYRRLLAVRLEGVGEAAVAHAARRLGEAARRAPAGVRVLGPAPAPLSRLRGKVRYQLLLAGPDQRPLRALALRLEAEAQRREFSAVRVTFDVDPGSLL